MRSIRACGDRCPLNKPKAKTSPPVKGPKPDPKVDSNEPKPAPEACVESTVESGGLSSCCGVELFSGFQYGDTPYINQHIALPGPPWSRIDRIPVSTDELHKLVESARTGKDQNLNEPYPNYKKGVVLATTSGGQLAAARMLQDYGFILVCEFHNPAHPSVADQAAVYDFVKVWIYPLVEKATICEPAKHINPLPPSPVPTTEPKAMAAGAELTTKPKGDK